MQFLMRISEILALTVGNLHIDRERKLLAYKFEKTKADQFTAGVTGDVPLTPELIDPVQAVEWQNYFLFIKP